MDPLLVVGWAEEISSLSMLPVFHSGASDLGELSDLCGLRGQVANWRPDGAEELP